MKRSPVAALFLSIFLLISLISLISAGVSTTPVAANAAPTTTSTSDDYLWTPWGAMQWDIAADGDTILIAATGSILQWVTTTGATTRYSAVDGLPHTAVYAIAVAPDGARWFGGDAGVSRQDAAGVWTHFNTDNSELLDNRVGGIAVAVDGSLWFLHNLAFPGGVTHWLPDGSARWYPDLRTAVVQSYAQVLQTTNVNNLWTVSGNDVWLGAQVYNGSTWLERRPSQIPYDDLAVRAGPDGIVYAIAASGSSSLVFRWQENTAAWTSFELSFDTMVNTLAIAPDGAIWLTWQEPQPYSDPAAYIGRLSPDFDALDLVEDLPVSDAVSDLLVTSEGPWAIGRGWILTPDLALTHLDDTPRDHLARAIIAAGNTLFLQSTSTIQTLDDRGTARLEDDAWGDETFVYSPTVFEPLRDGGAWVLGSDPSRAGPYFRNLRYHDGDWIEHGPAGIVYDLFSHTTRDTWFVTVDPYNAGQRTVTHLDDGGTPATTGDDVWTQYPLAGAGQGGAVAVDSLNRIWFADDTGLYRHDGAGWQLIFGGGANGVPLLDVAVAADNTIFALCAGACDGLTYNQPPTVIVVRPGGAVESTTVAALVHHEFDRVATVSYPNRLWSVAPDGAVWYIEDGGFPTSHIVRRHHSQDTIFDLPYENPYQRDPFVVDHNNHLWITAHGVLWRLSPRPTFQIDARTWFIAPATTRHQILAIRAIAGYDEPVDLQFSGLPTGLTAAIEPNPPHAGQFTTVTLTAGAALRRGHYGFWLSATDGQTTRHIPITLRVVSSVHDAYAPLMLGSHTPAPTNLAP